MKKNKQQHDFEKLFYALIKKQIREKKNEGTIIDDEVYISAEIERLEKNSPFV